MKAFPVDLANADDDGAVRLVARGTVECLESEGITLSDGLQIVISDGEITTEATCHLRDGA